MSLRSWIVWRGKDLGYGLLSKVLWPRSSAAALVLDEGKLLAIDTGDYLMLPGGGLEHGETFEQAVEREVLEETGLKVEVLDRIHETVNSVGGPEVFFTAEPSGGELEDYWEGTPQWIELEEVKGERWRHDNDIAALVEKTR